MKKDQLFKKNPSNELFNKVLNAFGLSGVDDNRCFSRKDLEYIKCTIEDNGIGRDASKSINLANTKKHNSKGMSITEKRIYLINELQDIKSQIKITDLNKGNTKGTKVEFKLKYKL